jgi:endonuclease YncB( thermonuclease family)
MTGKRKRPRDPLFSIRFLFVTLAGFFAFHLQSRAEPIAHPKIRVMDGDTVEARGYRWRLLGYDTPESRDMPKVSPIKKMLGKAAKEKLEGLLKSRTLDLTERRCSCPDKTIGTNKCHHGRRCGLLTWNGENVGNQLIKEMCVRLARRRLDLSPTVHGGLICR